LKTPCETCITKAICLQKDYITCVNLVEYFLEKYNVIPFINRNTIVFIEIRLKIEKGTVGIILHLSDDINLVEFRGYKTDTVTNLKKYILNKKRPIISIQIHLNRLVHMEMENKIKKKFAQMSHFKNVKVFIT
jgi:hypothetical protein